MPSLVKPHICKTCRRRLGLSCYKNGSKNAVKVKPSSSCPDWADESIPLSTLMVRVPQGVTGQ